MSYLEYSMNCFYFTQYESSNMITKTMEEFKRININFSLLVGSKNRLFYEMV
jgi:hypothetical protein